MRRSVEIAIVAGLIGVARGQIPGQATTNVTCIAQTEWMQNSLGQNPCLVSAYLSGECNDGTWFVPTLLADGPYNAPEGTGNAGATECRCNTVVYNLLQACSVCQGGVIGSWGDWISFCNASNVSKGYPEEVPGGTIVPGWADLDPTVSGSWNATQAEQYAEQSGGSGGSGSGSTGSSSSSAHKKSDTGAIVGGVVGGIIGLIILAVTIFFCMRWRRNREGKGEKVTPTPYHPAGGAIDQGYNHNGYIEKEIPHRTDLGTPAPPSMPTPMHHNVNMKPYDPSDPSTFPMTPEPTSLSHGRNPSMEFSQHGGPGGFSQYQHSLSGPGSPAPYGSPMMGRQTGAYTGAAEV